MIAIALTEILLRLQPFPESRGLWGSLVSFQLRELETPVQIRTDPLTIIIEQTRSAYARCLKYLGTEKKGMAEEDFVK